MKPTLIYHRAGPHGEVQWIFSTSPAQPEALATPGSTWVATDKHGHVTELSRRAIKQLCASTGGLTTDAVGIVKPALRQMLADFCHRAEIGSL